MEKVDINKIANNLNDRLMVAYHAPLELLGRQVVKFVDTTNEAFANRKGHNGELSMVGATAQFFAFGRSMHTSYVVNITYCSSDNSLIINTRNSKYTFEVLDGGSKCLKDNGNFYWELNSNLQKDYEDFINQNFDSLMVR